MTDDLLGSKPDPADVPVRTWEPETTSPAVEPRKKGKPGRKPGSGGHNRIVVTDSGRPAANLVVPLTSSGSIAWGGMSEEKGERVSDLFTTDARIRSKIIVGDTTTEIGPEAVQWIAGVLGQGLVYLARARGYSEEVAELMRLRREQVEPIEQPAIRVLKKRVGAISDEAFIGIGLGMAVLQNFAAVQQRHAEIEAAKKAEAAA